MNKREAEWQRRLVEELRAESARIAQPRRPIDRLLRVISALERGGAIEDDDRRWFVDGLKAFVDELGEQPLDKLLGLAGDRRGGPGTVLAKDRIAWRDGQYRAQMVLHVAAGYADAEAARIVAQKLDPLMRNRSRSKDAGALIPRRLIGKPLSADTLARRYQGWKTEKPPEWFLLANSDEIERLRAERLEQREPRKIRRKVRT